MNRKRVNKTQKNVKAYMAESSITGSGKGLFASIDIKNGSIIAEFKGKLRKPHEKQTSTRSNIFFHDDYILDCPLTDLASFANDAISFPKERRKLIESLQSDKPFYKKYDGAIVNASIKVNNELHRAFLKTECDIKKDTEIFCHYGFEYWFMNELTKKGFLQEEEIEKNGFPKNVYEYPAFTSYIHEFYEGVKKIEVRPYDETTTDVILHFLDGDFLVMPMKNYANHISKLPENDILVQML